MVTGEHTSLKATHHHHHVTPAPATVAYQRKILLDELLPARIFVHSPNDNILTFNQVRLFKYNYDRVELFRKLKSLNL